MSALAPLAALALLAGEPPLTEGRAVELALAADPQLSALRHGVDERLALRDAAGALENPELRVQGLRSDRLVAPAVSGTPYAAAPLDGARAGVRWQPPGLGERRERRAAADAEVARASAELAVVRAAAAARVRAFHATVRGLDAVLAVARAARDERRRLRELVGRRAGQGGATAIDESAAEVDLLEAQAELDAAELRRARAHAGLLAELGLAPGTAVELSAEGAAGCAAPEEPGPGPAPDDPWRRALQAELRANDAALSRSRRSLVPWPTFAQLSYVLREDAASSYWSLSFGLTLPLLDARRAERRALVEARARLEDEQRARAAAAGRELRRAEAELAVQRALARRHADTAAALEGCLERFHRGGEGVALIQAGELRARQLTARRAQLEAELQCALRRIEVDRLAGTAGAAKAG